MSHSASSIPAMALAAMPPGLWRDMRYMSQYRISTGRGSRPIRMASNSCTVVTTPYGLRPSEHSPYPVMPASVRTATNCHGRHPASTTNVSIPVIFIETSPPDPTNPLRQWGG